MRQTKDLFLKVMDTLNTHLVLGQVILIGSWCQFFYQHYFNEEVLIPAVRTLDLDFLIPNPPNIKEDVNVSDLLTGMGFTIQTHSHSGLIKYNHPDLMVEFLIPELGKGKDTAYDIPKLHINAVGLRYLNLLQDHILEIKYEHLNIRLPEPAAFVLHKHIISERRLNVDKRNKDKQSAIELGKFLLSLPNQREKLIEVFSGMPKKWQKNLLSILAQYHIEMHDFLKDTQ